MAAHLGIATGQNAMVHGVTEQRAIAAESRFAAVNVATFSETKLRGVIVHLPSVNECVGDAAPSTIHGNWSVAVQPL
jgi:hypothetical protein